MWPTYSFGARADRRVEIRAFLHSNCFTYATQYLYQRALANNILQLLFRHLVVRSCDYCLASLFSLDSDAIGRNLYFRFRPRRSHFIDCTCLSVREVPHFVLCFDSCDA